MPRSVILGSLLCVGTVVVSRWAGILRVGAGPRVVIRGGGCRREDGSEWRGFRWSAPHVQVSLVQLNVPAMGILCSSLSGRGRNQSPPPRLVHRNAVPGAERCTYETCTPAQDEREQDKVTNGKKEKKQEKGKRNKGEGGFQKKLRKKYGILLKKLGDRDFLFIFAP